MEDWSAVYAFDVKNPAPYAAQKDLYVAERAELAKTWKQCVERSCADGKPLADAWCPLDAQPMRSHLDAMSTPACYLVVHKIPAWYDPHTGESGGPWWTLKPARGLWDQLWDASKR
jgi:hypothetical protein